MPPAFPRQQRYAKRLGIAGIDFDGSEPVEIRARQFDAPMILSDAPKDASVLSKPFHLKDLVNEVERLLAA